MSGLTTRCRCSVSTDSKDLTMQAVLLSMHKPMPGHIFNIVDNDCSSRDVVLAYAASLLRTPALGDESETLQAGSSSCGDVHNPSHRHHDAGTGSHRHAGHVAGFSGAAVPENASGYNSVTGTGRQANAAEEGVDAIVGGQLEGKRVSNRKAIECLGWKLKYPTYKEGLSALAESLDGCPDV